MRGRRRPVSHRWAFPGAHGDPLAARLELPGGSREPHAYALFAHCFTCGKDAVAAARIARFLAERGIAVLRFDFTGVGDSGGEFSHTGFTSNVEDLVRAADALRTERQAPALLVGHSLGGAAALAAAARIPETRAVVTIAAPADPGHVRRQLPPRAVAEIEERGEAEVLLAGRPFRIGRGFLQDIAEQPQRSRIAGLDVPLLVLHSPQDELVGVEESREIFEAARHPKSFVALDGMDHLLTGREDAAWVAGLIAAWSSRYLGR